MTGESLIVIVLRNSACMSDRCRGDLLHSMLPAVARYASQSLSQVSVTALMISVSMSALCGIVVSYNYRGAQPSEDNRKSRCDRCGSMTTMIARKDQVWQIFCYAQKKVV